jgi:hypothetical protein
MPLFGGILPFRVGLVQRIKNCRSRNVSSGWSHNFEITKTDLVSITDELLGNFDEFLELVGHADWIGEVVGGREKYWLRCEVCGKSCRRVIPAHVMI